MEMRAGGAAGRPYLADDLPRCDQVSVFDQHFRQMEIHRIEPQAVIDKDAFAGKNMIDGDADNPIIRRRDIGPHRRADILSIVRIARLAVHDPHAAENAGALAIHRFHEVAVP